MDEMTPKIIVYHSVLGIRQGEKNLAERMRKLGFEVIVQDLYEGKVFDDYESGLALFEEMGVMGLVAQAQKGLEGMEGPVIFSGFSNGGALAEVMTLQYPQTVGCLLFHAALPVEEIGAAEWPKEVPVQVHYADKDPWREEEYVEKFLEQVAASGSPVTFHEYHTKGHLFTDPTLPDEYNEKAAEELYRHVTQFLNSFAGNE
nr:dienelactone hydrolase family protein [Atopococcus tabaci]